MNAIIKCTLLPSITSNMQESTHLSTFDSQLASLFNILIKTHLVELLQLKKGGKEGLFLWELLNEADFCHRNASVCFLCITWQRSQTNLTIFFSSRFSLRQVFTFSFPKTCSMAGTKSNWSTKKITKCKSSVRTIKKSHKKFEKKVFHVQAMKFKQSKGVRWDVSCLTGYCTWRESCALVLLVIPCVKSAKSCQTWVENLLLLCCMLRDEPDKFPAAPVIEPRDRVSVYMWVIITSWR